MYLEQELDSLKVVLEMKNNQLHQKEKKLMEMDKLVSVRPPGSLPSEVPSGLLDSVPRPCGRWRPTSNWRSV